MEEDKIDVNISTKIFILFIVIFACLGFLFVILNKNSVNNNVDDLNDEFQILGNKSLNIGEDSSVIVKKNLLVNVLDDDMVAMRNMLCELEDENTGNVISLRSDEKGKCNFFANSDKKYLATVYWTEDKTVKTKVKIESSEAFVYFLEPSEKNKNNVLKNNFENNKKDIFVIASIFDKSGVSKNVKCELQTIDEGGNIITVSSDKGSKGKDCMLATLNSNNPYILRVFWLEDESLSTSINLGNMRNGEIRNINAIKP